MEPAELEQAIIVAPCSRSVLSIRISHPQSALTIWKPTVFQPVAMMTPVVESNELEHAIIVAPCSRLALSIRDSPPRSFTVIREPSVLQRGATMIPTLEPVHFILSSHTQIIQIKELAEMSGVSTEVAHLTKPVPFSTCSHTQEIHTEELAIVPYRPAPRLVVSIRHSHPQIPLKRVVVDPYRMPRMDPSYLKAQWLWLTEKLMKHLYDQAILAPRPPFPLAITDREESELTDSEEENRVEEAVKDSLSSPKGTSSPLSEEKSMAQESEASISSQKPVPEKGIRTCS